MTYLEITIHWDGDDRADAAARKRIVESIKQKFPTAEESGSGGFSDNMSYTELRVIEVGEMGGHPNLSPEINANIAQSERDGGIWTKDVPVGSTVLVQTCNTLYTLVNHGERWVGQGGKHLPEMTVVHVNGSTFGGSMIKVGFIGIGMHLELAVYGWEHGRGPLTTTPIQTIEVVLPEESKD